MEQITRNRETSSIKVEVNYQYIRLWRLTQNNKQPDRDSKRVPFVYKCRTFSTHPGSYVVELVRNLMEHDAREGKWRGNWRMEWVASTLTPPPNTVYPALLKLMRTPRLPAVDWTDAPTDLNGLVPFEERRNLVSARVPSHSARAIPKDQDSLLPNPSLFMIHQPPYSTPQTQNN